MAFNECWHCFLSFLVLHLVGFVLLGGAWLVIYGQERSPASQFRRHTKVLSGSTTQALSQSSGSPAADEVNVFVQAKKTQEIRERFLGYKGLLADWNGLFTNGNI